MADFQIDQRLLAKSEPLVSLTLSEVRLWGDARWPWLVLIPRQAGAKEIEHLSREARVKLMDEVVAAGAAVRAMGAALGRPVEKLNVGALGNKVEQLHLHVAGRRADDEAWPEPVWGFHGEGFYTDAQVAEVRAAALPAFEGLRKK